MYKVFSFTKRRINSVEFFFQTIDASLKCLQYTVFMGSEKGLSRLAIFLKVDFRHFISQYRLASCPFTRSVRRAFQHDDI